MLTKVGNELWQEDTLDISLRQVPGDYPAPDVWRSGAAFYPEYNNTSYNAEVTVYCVPRDPPYEIGDIGLY